jgi:hypothetical protein
MKSMTPVALAGAMALGLAACDETATTDAPVQSSEAPKAEAACIAGVNRNMPGADATVTSSDFSQAGTTVMLRSSDGTNWRCLASNDGILEDLAVVE